MSTILEAYDLANLHPEQMRELGKALLEAAETTQYETPPELIEELERRVAEFDADPSIGIPWEVVHAEAMERLAKMKHKQ